MGVENENLTYDHGVYMIKLGDIIRACPSIFNNSKNFSVIFYKRHVTVLPIL